MIQLQAAMEVKLKFFGTIHEWCRSQSGTRRNMIGVACAARSRHHRAMRKIIMQNRIPIRCGSSEGTPTTHRRGFTSPRGRNVVARYDSNFETVPLVARGDQARIKITSSQVTIVE
jgi:hypothetical protein